MEYRIEQKLGLLGLLFAGFLHQVAAADEIYLTLPEERGDQKESRICNDLVEKYLGEFRSILPETALILESQKSVPANSKQEPARADTERYNITCKISENQKEVTLKSVDATSSTRSFSFSYSLRASGFDSLDWLKFQRRNKSQIVSEPSNINLSPRSKSNLAFSDELKNTSLTPNTAATAPKPILASGWFWAAAGAIAATTFAVLNQGHASNTTPITIH